MLQRIFTAILIIGFKLLLAGDKTSSFTKITKDLIISTTSVSPVITKNINIEKDFNVLIVADGSFSPYTKNGIAKVLIQIDGKNSYSNTSVIDWQHSNNPQTHGFNCIASIKLSKGQHTIRLVAFADKTTPNSNFKINQGSGLSILVDAAPNMIDSKLSKESELINYKTFPKDGKVPIPMTTILTNQVNVGDEQTNVITLSSGSSYGYCGEGDALWGVFINDEICTNNSNSLWSVNDLITGAELKAPMFSHAFHQLKGKNTISLKAGELAFNYFENQACYRVAPDTRLVSLYGMKLSGRAVLSNNYCNREEWGCFGTSNKVSYCTPIGERREYAILNVDIPKDHNGIILFMTKVRLQPGRDDLGGKASIWLNIDGKDVGTIGIQDYKFPNCESSRTLSASFLTSDNNRLSPGKHEVRVYLQAEGNFNTISYSIDLPLVYLD